MQEVRCKKCKRLLYKGLVKQGVIEIQCRACGFINRLDYADSVVTQVIKR